ncbi:MAG TPA: site-2 protease family protein, partial [Poseidonia sp.]|nr:site-2 protease family protein [Poseidonia sp.]
IAGQFVAIDESVHVRVIGLDEGAYNAGIQPCDTLISIDGEPVDSPETFRDILRTYSANDTADVVVRHQEGERETLTVTFSDTHSHYSSLGYNNETLASMGVEPGDAFLGVVGISDGTDGIDRLAGPLGPRWEGTLGQRAVSVPFHLLSIMLVPFDLNGVAIHPFEESLLEAGDGIIASILGTNGLLFMTSFFFWLMWVNILLGFTNLIPMVPFDGGHMLKDMVHSWLSGLKRLGRKLKLWDLHPMWVDHLSQRASSYSSLALLGMLLFTIIIPYL